MLVKKVTLKMKLDNCYKQKMLHLRKRRKILLETHENELVARHVVDFYCAINCQIFAVMFKDAEATSTLCNRVFIHSLLSYHVLSGHKATMTSIKPVWW